MTVRARIHERYVHRRRTDVLAAHLARLLPPGASVLDVGTGDGLIVRKLIDIRPDVDLKAVEVLVRPDQHVAVEPFDGRSLPFPDDAFDAVLLVDVLHHAEDPEALLREAVRASRSTLVVKDVMSEGVLSRWTLHMMERVANSGHGISIPDSFWRRTEWEAVFRRLELAVESWNGRLGLYPFPASLVFERRFHFLALLRAQGLRATAQTD